MYTGRLKGILMHMSVIYNAASETGFQGRLGKSGFSGKFPQFISTLRTIIPGLNGNMKHINLGHYMPINSTKCQTVWKGP